MSFENVVSVPSTLLSPYRSSADTRIACSEQARPEWEADMRIVPRERDSDLVLLFNPIGGRNSFNKVGKFLAFKSIVMSDVLILDTHDFPV